MSDLNEMLGNAVPTAPDVTKFNEAQRRLYESCSPLTLDDIAFLESWLIADQAKRTNHYARQLDSQMQAAFLASQKVENLSFFSARGQEILLQSGIGMRQVLVRMMSKKQPQIMETDLTEYTKDLSFEQVVEVFGAVMQGTKQGN